MSSLHAILDIKALETRRSWLVLQIVSHSLIPAICLGMALLNLIVLFYTLDKTSLIAMAAVVFSLCLFYGAKFFVFYYFAYKKFGTKLLAIHIGMNLLGIFGCIAKLILDHSRFEMNIFLAIMLCVSVLQFYINRKMRLVNVKIKKHEKERLEQALEQAESENPS